MHVDREVERTVVGVGAEVNQCLGQVESIVDDGDDRRGRSVTVGRLGIRTACDQRPNRVFVAVARGIHESGEATGRVIGVLTLGERRDRGLDVWIGLRVEQCLDDVGVTFSGCPHQRRLLLIGVGGVDVHSCFEQQAHGVDAAGI